MEEARLDIAIGYINHEDVCRRTWQFSLLHTRTIRKENTNILLYRYYSQHSGATFLHMRQNCLHLYTYFAVVFVSHKLYGAISKFWSLQHISSATSVVQMTEILLGHCNSQISKEHSVIH